MNLLCQILYGRACGHEIHVWQHVSVLVREFLPVSNGVDCVHLQQFENSHVDCKLHTGAKVLSEYILSNKVKSPLLLIIQTGKIIDFETLIAGDISNDSLALCASQRELRV